MTEQEVQYLKTKTIEVPAYEWYLAMEMLGWIGAGELKSKSEVEAIAELRAAALRHYDRMRRDVMGEELFWRMKNAYKNLEAMVAKPKPEPDFCTVSGEGG